MSNIIRLTRWGDGQSIHISKESIIYFYRDKIYDEEELRVIAADEFPSAKILSEEDIKIVKSMAHYHICTIVIVRDYHELHVTESIEEILKMLD